MKSGRSIISKLLFPFLASILLFYYIPGIIHNSFAINTSASKILHKVVANPENLSNIKEEVLNKSDSNLYQCRTSALFGKAQSYTGNFLNAILTLEDTVRECPTNQPVLFTLATLEYHYGDKEKAIAYLSHSGVSGLFREQCGRLFQSKDYEGASTSCTLAVKLDSNDISSWEKLGDALYSLGNRAEAKYAFEQVLKRSNNNPVALVGLGNLYLAESQYELASEYFNQAIIFSPENPSAWFGMGIAYYELHKYIEAIDNFQKTVKLDPSRPAPHAYLGRSLYFVNRFKEASTELNIAVEILPNKLVYRKWLGDAYLKSGEKSRAIEQYKAVLQASPNDEKLQEKVHQLEENLGIREK